jgi:hypothetical protein
MFVVFSIHNVSAQTKEDIEHFLNHFSGIAVSEMHVHHIPASIKLAQAACETQWGTSELAKRCNNFFGTKCKANYEGDTYYKEDDDVGADGATVKSCFRVYEDAAQSFEDHSLFLARRPYYESLFTYGMDYKKWAYGLVQCGYATDLNYANKLIKIIEDYRLYQYDSKEYVVYKGPTPLAQSTAQQELMDDIAETGSTPPPVFVLPDGYRPGFERDADEEKAGETARPALVPSKQPQNPAAIIQRESKNGEGFLLERRQASKYEDIR